VFGPLGIAGVMTCIADCESNFEPQCFNGSCCYGLFQMNRIHEGGLKAAGIITNWDQMADPLVNARAAKWLFGRQGFAAWACFPQCATLVPPEDGVVVPGPPEDDVAVVLGL